MDRFPDERNARKHGGAKRPSPRFLEPVAKSWFDWHKVHLEIDEKSREIRAAEVTTGDIGDVEPVSATGSSEPARHAARLARRDPSRPGDRHSHR